MAVSEGRSFPCSAQRPYDRNDHPDGYFVFFEVRRSTRTTPSALPYIPSALDYRRSLQPTAPTPQRPAQRFKRGLIADVVTPPTSSEPPSLPSSRPSHNSLARSFTSHQPVQVLLGFLLQLVYPGPHPPVGGLPDGVAVGVHVLQPGPSVLGVDNLLKTFSKLLRDLRERLRLGV